MNGYEIDMSYGNIFIIKPSKKQFPRVLKANVILSSHRIFLIPLSVRRSIGQNIYDY